MDEAVIFCDAELWYNAKQVIDRFDYDKSPENKIVMISGNNVIKADYNYLKNFVKAPDTDRDTIEKAIDNLKKLQERLRTKNQKIANALKDFYPVCKKYYFDQTLLPAFIRILEKNGWLDNRKEKPKFEPKGKEEFKEQPKFEHKEKSRPDPHFKPNKNNSRISWISLSLIILIGGVLCYFLWFLPYKTDRDAPRNYTLVNTNLRSSQISGTEFNRVTTLPYGSELIVYEQDRDWSYVKWGKTKGYIATPYILSREDFFLLNSIFGNTESRECIETAKCRQAILHYFKQNHLYGKPDVEMPMEYLDTETNWQVYTKTKNVKPNSVFFPKLYDRNSKYTDFAFIIKNNNTAERRLVYYSFTDDEDPIFRYEETAPETGDIKDMRARGYSIETQYVQ